MPHAFLRKSVPLETLLQTLAGRTALIGDTRIKLGKPLVDLEQRAGLVPCLVIEPNREQWFYVQVRKKSGDTFLIRLDPITPAVRTAGVRLALAWMAHLLREEPPGGTVDPANIGEYFAVLQAPPEEQAGMLSLLRRKIARQMRAADLRKEAGRFVVALDALSPPLQWNEIFGRGGPVEIEIGPGKGRFLLSEAQAHPERNFLAIEWAGRYLKVLSERLPRAQLTNVRLLPADARAVFRDWIPENSVSRVHIYYPDPWWKKRHAKYRLFSPEFLQHLERALEPGGTFHFATDVPRVFEEVEEMVQQSTGLKPVHRKIYPAGKERPPGRTNFEIKKWEAGSDIFEAIWQKGESQ